MTKLNDTQLKILSAASQRRDFSVYPLPKSVKVGDGPKHLKKLLSLQMIEEVEAVGDAPVWRQHDDGYDMTLVLADAGFRALGVERDVTLEAGQKPARKSKKLPSSTSHESETTQTPISKQALIITLLKRPDGATLGELADATGWQRHSVHGMMSGVLKKKLGLTILSEQGAQGRTYRLAASAQ